MLSATQALLVLKGCWSLLSWRPVICLFVLMHENYAARLLFLREFLANLIWKCLEKKKTRKRVKKGKL